MTIETLMTKLASDFLLDKSAALAADTELLMSGLLDSLAVVALVAWLEDETGHHIDPLDIVIENFETPQAIHDLATSAA